MAYLDNDTQRGLGNPCEELSQAALPQSTAGTKQRGLDSLCPEGSLRLSSSNAAPNTLTQDQEWGKESEKSSALETF